MFEQCNQLLELNVGFITWPQDSETFVSNENPLEGWVQGIQTTDGMFIGHGSLNIHLESNYNDNQIPTKWWKDDTFRIVNIDFNGYFSSDNNILRSLADNEEETSGIYKSVYINDQYYNTNHFYNIKELTKVQEKTILPFPIIYLTYYKNIPYSYVDNNVKNKLMNLFEYSYDGKTYVKFDQIRIATFDYSYFDKDGNKIEEERIGQILYYMRVPQDIIKNPETNEIYTDKKYTLYIRNSQNKLGIFDYDKIQYPYEYNYEEKGETVILSNTSRSIYNGDEISSVTYNVKQNNILTGMSYYNFDNDNKTLVESNIKDFTSKGDSKADFNWLWSSGEPIGGFDEYITILNHSGMSAGKFNLEGNVMSLYSIDRSFDNYIDDEFVYKFPQPSEMFSLIGSGSYSETATNTINLNVNNLIDRIQYRKNNNAESLKTFSNKPILNFYSMFCCSRIKNLPKFSKIYKNHKYENILDLTFNDTLYIKYPGMFNDCGNLINNEDNDNILEFANVLNKHCYAGMFSYCYNFNTNNLNLEFNNLPSASCYRMFYSAGSNNENTDNLTNLSININCDETNEVSCYQMFNYSKFIINQAILMPNKLSSYCYGQMFNNVYKLENIKVGFTEWPADDNNTETKSWVTNVGTTGTFMRPNALPLKYGDNNIPEGWTVVKY